MNETTHTAPATKAPKQRKAPKQWKRSSLAMNPNAIAQRIILLALVIWAIRDIQRRRDDELNGDRKIWTLAAFAPPIGPIAYFLLGRKRSASS